MIRKAVFAVALSVFTLAQAADKLVGGPYVVHAGTNSATVGWVFETGDSLRCLKIGLTGLIPGSTVQYDVPEKVGSTMTPDALQAAKGRFKTAPTGLANFEFVVFGDTRTRHDLHRRIIEAMVKTNPDFVIHTGDLVQDGTDAKMWPTFFDIERELLRKAAFFPVLGNHEKNSTQFYDFFDVGKPYYSFDWGTAHFVIIDSDVANLSKNVPEREAFWNEQTKWLEEDLAKNQKADFRFVTMHHPPFTVNSDKGAHVSKETPTLVPMFEKYKVTAVFAGHDHNYQRHVKNGIQYIVTGGGGAPLANIGKPLPGITVKVESTEHFVPIKVQGNRAHVEAIALDGHVIDTVELGPGAR